MYQVFSSDNGDDVQHWTFCKREEGEWRVLGRYAAEPAMPGYTGMNAIPCDGGRFILVSYVPPEADGAGGWQPFCVASFPEGSESLRLDYAIDHGQDALRRYASDQFRTDLELFGYTAVTDSHAVVIHPYTGLFWAFSLEKARLVKVGGIFKKVTPEMIANGGFTGAVLCVNPERQGTVLVAAQDEEYFIRNGDLWKEYVEARIARLNDWEKSRHARDDSPNDAEAVARSVEKREEAFNAISKEVKEEMRPRFRHLLENSPHIVWYRIHPENGRVERLVEPPEGGAALRGDDGWDNWESNEFRPMADGSVKMGWVSGKIKERAGDGAGGASQKEVGGGAQAAGLDPGGDAPPEDNAADGGADKDKAAGEGGAPAA
jgi:PAS domain-containing protein